MPTKYELQAELRSLAKGIIHIPITQLKKGELEQRIALFRGYKQDTEALPAAPKSKTGSPGPRDIPIADTKIAAGGAGAGAGAEFGIRVPVPPSERPTNKRPLGRPKLAKPRTQIRHMEDAELDAEGSLFPSVAKAAAERAERAERAEKPAPPASKSSEDDALALKVMRMLKAMRE